MRFRAAFVSDGRVSIPENFHAVFASLLGEILNGYTLEGEPYTFSLRLNPGVAFKGKQFEGVRYVLMRFSSGSPEVFDTVIDGVIRIKDRWESVVLGGGRFRVGDITVEQDRPLRSSFFTLSPVVLEREGTFLLPESEGYGEKLRETMAIRMRLLEGREPERFSVEVVEHEGVEVPSLRGRTRGFVGRIKLLADAHTMRFAHDYGLGSRTTDGFGMLEVI